MASRKRSRHLDDVDGEVEIESASSSFRQSFPKRSRVALAQENGGSVVSDDDDEDGDGTEYGGGQSQHGPSGGYMDYDDDDDEDDGGIDELQATQIVQKQIREHRDNIASEEGVIEEVFCRNFMCHSKLRIKLGPLINFIIGHNGSGKSAVLTALTMCLGGKATTTNRGASLKSLIKEGEESATLAVKIKNQGESAYKPDQYGRSITVERNFSRSGTSNFKIKNAEDKVISTKKADLDDILDYFAFQLDNPINVLTQDMARQFLSNSTPADKYKFFIRGTQLESLDRDYQLLEEHLDTVERKLEGRQEDIDVLKRKMDQAEQRKKRSEQTQKLQDKITELQMQHAWAQVQEQEEVLEQHNEAVRAAEQELEQKREQAESDSAVFDAKDKLREEAVQSHDTLKNDLEPLNGTRNNAKEKFDANAKALGDVQAQARIIKENGNSHQARIDKTQENIEEERRRLAGAEGDEHAKRMSTLQELKDKAQEATRAQMDHGKGIAGLETKRGAAKKAVDEFAPIFDEKRNAVRSAESRLNNLRNEQPRPYAGYRPNMEHAVKAIEQETRWRTKPVGPMGKHVTLLEAKWASQIEVTMGGAFDSFVVTCKEDQNLLNQLLRRTRCNAAVIIGDPEPIDTTPGEPDPGTKTILRVLRIDNDLVRNQLVIQNFVDQSALVETFAVAREFMSGTPQAPHGPPRNVKAAICISEGGTGGRFDSTRTGQPRQSHIKAWQGGSRMKSNREDQVKVAQELLRLARAALQTAEQQHRELQTAFNKSQQAVERFKREQRDLKIATQSAEDAVEALQGEIDSNRPENGKLQELENQLAEAKDDLDSELRSFDDVKAAKADLNVKARELKTVLDAAQRECDEIQSRIDRAEGKVRKAQADRENALHQKNLAFGLIDSTQKEIDKCIGRRDRQQQTVEQFTTCAEQVGGRVAVPNGLRAHQFDAQIKQLTDDIKRRQQEIGGSRQELTLAFQKARQDYTDARREMQGMEGVAKALKDTLINRQYRWKMFRKFISYRARFTFSYLLSERQFRGRVLMNHADKELDINVEPDLSKVSDAGRQTKTLSGGEKSFSTICLLLSIWEAMGSPIRCLDEFDVFMDSVNRATSMTMMIQAARRSVGRQFILITPQSMNSVEMGDDVRVHKMSDPERGQTALPY